MFYISESGNAINGLTDIQYFLHFNIINGNTNQNDVAGISITDLITWVLFNNLLLNWSSIFQHIFCPEIQNNSIFIGYLATSKIGIKSRLGINEIKARPIFVEILP